MAATLHGPQENRLLAALGPDARQRIYPQLRLTDMPLGKVLYEPGGGYFRGLYRLLLYVFKDGMSAEISVVENEGLIGVSLFMGGETTPSRAVVQSAGHAYHERRATQREFGQNGQMQLLILRYTQALITQMAQTAVCNRHHTVISNCAAGCCYRSTASVMSWS